MSFTVTDHTVDCQHLREYPRAAAPQDAPLKLLVKKYTPVDNPHPQPGDVTLIGVPGTGLPKVRPAYRAVPMLMIGTLRTAMGGASGEKRPARLQDPRYLDRRLV